MTKPVPAAAIARNSPSAAVSLTVTDEVSRGSWHESTHLWAWCDVREAGYEEELPGHSSAAHLRRPRPDYASPATLLDRSELGALLVGAGHQTLFRLFASWPSIAAVELYAVRQRRGGPWNWDRDLRAQDGFAGHARFMDHLVDSGFIVLGGPLQGEREVLLIVRAPDDEAVQERFADDPWVQSGMLALATVERWTILLDGLTGRLPESAQILPGT